MDLEVSDHRHLRAAHGYIQLGMFMEANEQLERITPVQRHLPEVLHTRLTIYQSLGKWELMAVVAEKLVEWNPEQPAHFVDLAYAKRRANGFHIAHAILIRAAELHPDDATIQYNLACYESQLGNVAGAKAHLTKATVADARFSKLALDDPDLEPLWNSLGSEQQA